MYDGSKKNWQRLRPISIHNVDVIKVDVQKLLEVGFINLVSLTEWVYNHILVDKKLGTFRVCINYRDLNLDSPKDNYLTPFTDKIFNECIRKSIFSFMDCFFGYNKIHIKIEDQQKTTFIYPWGIISYLKLPFHLKNSSFTFQ